MTTNDGPASARFTGKVLRGKYRVERVLGEGGMGIVVLARHLKLDQNVAIKMLRAEARARPGVVARFAREARAAARLKSEHVVRIFDVDEDDDGDAFFVMEHLSGRDLEQLSAEEGPMPIDRAVDFVLQACEAVAEAHSLGMVHRDLKPANLFVVRKRDGSSVVKLLDFGISKAEDGSVEDVSLTSPASVIGSPLYMSPEQLKSSKDVDGRADIWALGVVLFQLLTGATPFDGESSSALAARIASEPPRSVRAHRPDVADELVSAIERCLAKDLEQRFQNAVELARAIAPFAPGAPATIEARIAEVARAAEVEDPALGVTMPEAAPPAPAGQTPRVTEAISERLPTASSSLAKTTGSPSAKSVPPAKPAEPAETTASQDENAPSRRRMVGLVALALAAAGAILVLRSRSTDSVALQDASFLGSPSTPASAAVSAEAPRIDARATASPASAPASSTPAASAPAHPASTPGATRPKPSASTPPQTASDAASPAPPPASAAKDPLQIEIK